MKEQERIRAHSPSGVIVFVLLFMLLTAAGGIRSVSASVKTIALDSDVLDYTSPYNETLQITNETRNGIYFFSDGTLGFYSLSSGSYKTVYTFSGCTSAYEEGDKLYVLDDVTCYVYNLNTNKLSKTITLSKLSSSSSVSATTAVGVDPKGRIYVATSGTDSSDEAVYKLWLFSSSGSYLSSCTVENRVYRFSGFNSSGSKFYMESYYNWHYWGYDHPGRGITMGTVSDNKIKFKSTSSTVSPSTYISQTIDCIAYICQSSYYLHQGGADVIGGKYLVTASTTFGDVKVISTSSMETILDLSRDAIEEDQSDSYYDVSSIGVRAVYNEANESIIVYRDGKTLEEYDPDTGDVIGTYETAHYVFNLLTLGDDVVIIEKEDGKYYIEIINWVTPTKLSLSVSSATMKAGKSQTVKVSHSADYSLSYTWKSSDSKIVSVNSSGKLSAWKKGTAKITCTASNGKTATITIKVSGSAVSTPSSTSKTLSGNTTENISDNNYTVYGSTVNSYLTQNSDGTYTRVQYTGSKVVVETYSSSYKLKSTKTIKMELDLFGGFYSGETYNYLVFGQKNTSEKDSKEVIRVVKYSKKWKRISSCSIKGANTYVPFSSGSARMTETDGKLYLYTCHTMYETSDGYHHQANMTFVIKESSMEVTDSYYDVMNISYGYVSHSFNQFIQTDGTYIYRVDHGDAYPRAVTITRASVDGSVTSVSYTSALTIQGTSGANATGVSVGGFELSDNNCIIAGNSVDQSSSSGYSAGGQRNIFITVTDKSTLSTTTKWLTDYSSSDGVTVYTPQLVKLSADRFLVMWEEYYELTGKTVTRMVTINGEGKKTSSTICSTVRLSDCQPIVTSSGRVVWYVSDGSKVKMYTINPYDLPADTTVSEASRLELSESDVSLSYTSVTYNGKTRKPSVTVTYGGTTLKEGTDYTVSYASGRKKIGKYKVKIKGKGDYRGTVSVYFKIVPKQAKISSASSSSSGKITVKWSKVSGSVSYQIAYRKKGSSEWSYKKVDASTYKKTLTGLTSGKYYYVKVRAYKKADGKTYYGKWSSKELVKVK